MTIPTRLIDAGRGFASYQEGLRLKQREQPLNRVAIPLRPGWIDICETMSHDVRA